MDTILDFLTEKNQVLRVQFFIVFSIPSPLLLSVACIPPMYKISSSFSLLQSIDSKERVY